MPVPVLTTLLDGVTVVLHMPACVGSLGSRTFQVVPSSAEKTTPRKEPPLPLVSGMAIL